MRITSINPSTTKRNSFILGILMVYFTATTTFAIDSVALKAQVRLQKGKAYVKSYQYEKAIEEFTEAIQFKPKLAEAYHRRGSAYFHLKEYSKACQDWKQACTIDVSCIGWNFGIAKNLCNSSEK